MSRAILHILTLAFLFSSRFQFPDTDASNQRLAIDISLSSKSPQEQRRYSKRRLRGPYGEMLEEEMRKSGEKQKSAYSDLSFLQEICETKAKSQQEIPSTENVASQTQSRSAMFLSSQSLDDASSISSKNDLAMCVTPKRKISANYPLLTDNETVAIASDEDITPTKPQPNTEDLFNNSLVNSAAESSPETKSTREKKSKEINKINKGLNEPPKIIDRHSDTRTHVVGELYDTEKSYVESLQILANLLTLCYTLEEKKFPGEVPSVSFCDLVFKKLDYLQNFLVEEMGHYNSARKESNMVLHNKTKSYCIKFHT